MWEYPLVLYVLMERGAVSADAARDWVVNLKIPLDRNGESVVATLHQSGSADRKQVVFDFGCAIGNIDNKAVFVISHEDEDHRALLESGKKDSIQPLSRQNLFWHRPLPKEISYFNKAFPKKIIPPTKSGTLPVECRRTEKDPDKFCVDAVPYDRYDWPSFFPFASSPPADRCLGNGLELRFFEPDMREYLCCDPNDHSMVTLLTETMDGHRPFRALFTGDAPSSLLLSHRGRPQPDPTVEFPLEYDVIQIPHHGSTAPGYNTVEQFCTLIADYYIVCAPDVADRKKAAAHDLTHLPELVTNIRIAQEYRRRIQPDRKPLCYRNDKATIILAVDGLQKKELCEKDRDTAERTLQWLLALRAAQGNVRGPDGQTVQTPEVEILLPKESTRPIRLRFSVKKGIRKVNSSADIAKMLSDTKTLTEALECLTEALKDQNKTRMDDLRTLEDAFMHFPSAVPDDVPPFANRVYPFLPLLNVMNTPTLEEKKRLRAAHELGKLFNETASGSFFLSRCLIYLRNCIHAGRLIPDFMKLFIQEVLSGIETPENIYLACRWLHRRKASVPTAATRTFLQRCSFYSPKVHSVFALLWNDVFDLNTPEEIIAIWARFAAECKEYEKVQIVKYEEDAEMVLIEGDLAALAARTLALMKPDLQSLQTVVELFSERLVFPTEAAPLLSEVLPRLLVQRRLDDQEPANDANNFAPRVWILIANLTARFLQTRCSDFDFLPFFLDEIMQFFIRWPIGSARFKALTPVLEVLFQKLRFHRRFQKELKKDNPDAAELTNKRTMVEGWTGPPPDDDDKNKKK
ncbi:hypothetical protein PAPYR_10727 [Paratrimastix pyriformis]|uniref:Uncharacterized protein n=1 Tax=Paratrimastix pyriformis TaxID=342808 RepID=A0ABQ8U5C0_9EUKA|nr:hypothetical protein PAPYR_10727 [Paratrimastix pyriformis]